MNCSHLVPRTTDENGHMWHGHTHLYLYVLFLLIQMSELKRLPVITDCWRNGNDNMRNNTLLC
jgi:hypothetical protein